MTVASGSSGRLRSILGGALGNLVEWYDWYVYSAFSLYFAPVFFPGSDPLAQLLNTSGIFALGFFMRPVGGWLLGRLADRRGRRTALTLSVTLMCAGSLVIALTPGFGAIGIAAPIVLTLARMLQGLSVGGEFGTSATYIAEVAGDAHRGFWSGIQYATLVLGQLVALAILLLLRFVFLDEATLEAWGWRVPFLIGAALAVIVFWLRRGIAETDAFRGEGEGERRRAGLRALLAEAPKPVIVVLLVAAGGNVMFYSFTTYMQKFLVQTVGFGRDTASLVVAGALAVFMLAQPAAGALSDQVGRRPLLLWFGVAGVMAVVPLFRAIAATRDPWTAWALISGMLLIATGLTSVSAAFKAELFPARIRALGVGLPYALSVSLFGGTAEYVALWFKAAGHEGGYFWYVAAMVALSLAAILAVPETRWRSAMSER